MGYTICVTVVEHLRKGQPDYELAKCGQWRDPPVPVTALRLFDVPELDGLLYGWSADPRGANDGWRGLVLAPREFAAGLWTEFLGWVHAEHIPQRHG